MTTTAMTMRMTRTVVLPTKGRIVGDHGPLLQQPQPPPQAPKDVGHLGIVETMEAADQVVDVGHLGVEHQLSPGDFMRCLSFRQIVGESRSFLIAILSDDLPNLRT